MSKKVILKKEEIERLYKTRNLEETATILGVSVITLRRRMQEVGVESHSTGWRDDTVIDRELLEKLYKKHSAPDIAAILKVNLKTVYARLREYGIKIRASGGERKFDPDPKELNDLYSSKKLSVVEIANHYGVGPSLVIRRLQEAGMTDKQIRAEKERRRNVEAKQKNCYTAKVWRRSVLQRDGFRCVRCGSKGGVCKHCGHNAFLHTHHIKPVSTHPELRFVVKNGITLCRVCHMKEHRKSIG